MGFEDGKKPDTHFTPADHKDLAALPEFELGQHVLVQRAKEGTGSGAIEEWIVTGRLLVEERLPGL